ncbi:MAG: RNA polymerase sigma factor [Heyndrickxia sp.]
MDANKLLEEWFHSYGKEIYNYLIYMLWSEDVDDLLQEVFYRAYKGIDKFKGDSHPKTWLYSIARNVVFDFKRKEKSLYKKSQLMKNSDVNTAIDHKTPEYIYETNIRTQELMKSINMLKQNYRDVIILRGIKDFSVKETAQILGWSESKVNVSYHRALKKMKILLEKREGQF